MYSSNRRQPPSHGKMECEQDSSDSESELNILNYFKDSSSTGTLDSFVPYTMSPIPSKRGTKNFKLKAGFVGSKNATINVNNSPHTVLDLRTVLRNNKETYYKKPVMEKDVLEGGMKTHNHKGLKTEKADENCQSAFNFLVKKMEKTEEKLMQTEKERDMWKEKCSKLENEKMCQSCEERSMQEIIKEEVIEMLTKKNEDLATELKNKQETHTLRVEHLNQLLKSCEELVTKMNEQIKDENKSHAIAMNSLKTKFQAREENLCKKQSEMQAVIRRLEKEVADKKQQLLDNQKHVVVLTKQRKNEKETFENKLAKLEQQFQAREGNFCKKESEMQALIRSLEKEVADQKQQFLDSQKHVVVLTKQREDEKETHNSTVNRLKNKLAKLEQQYKDSEEERSIWMENAQELTYEKNSVLASKRRLQKELAKKKNALKSSQIKCNNQKKIYDDLCRIIDQSERTTNARMNAVMAQLATLTTKSNNLRIHNFMLQDLVNVFERRVEAFEGREEDHRVLREALGQVLDDLQNPPQAVNQLANAAVINGPQLPQLAVLPQAEILLLYCEITSDVHVPD